MSKVTRKRWVKIFAAVSFLVLLQLAWWTTLFLQDVSLMADLRRENLALQSHIPGAHSTVTMEKIESEAFHRRVMFLSESIFFALMTCIGLWLLYRALKIEERSRDIQKSFVEIISHESKTPLTALKLRLESTLEKLPPDARRDSLLALEEVRRLSSIFDKAMNLNRMERHALSFEELTLADVVREVTRRLEPFFRSRGAHVALDLDPEVVVKGDAYGLQNTVQSLLENAVLYNPNEERQVSVHLRRLSTSAVLDIADNGPGIAEVDRLRLFDRFYRGQSGRGVPGTGLGLYIAKHIVEAHHGQIRLVDDYRIGTKFEIALPLSGGAA